MAAFLFAFFGLVVILALGFLVISAARALARLALAASLALLFGFIIGAVLAPGAAEQIPVSLFLALVLVVPTYALLRTRQTKVLMSGPADSLPAPSKVIKEAPDPAPAQRLGWFRRRRSDPLSRFNAAWDNLAIEAVGSENRVAVARRSCERFRSALKNSPLDPQAHGLLVLLEKRVPEVIEVQLRKLKECGERERRTTLECLLDLLERLAADCERRQAASPAVAGEDVIIRAHIEAHLRRDPLSPV